jgi:hypothetical protein
MSKSWDVSGIDQFLALSCGNFHKFKVFVFNGFSLALRFDALAPKICVFTGMVRLPQAIVPGSL